MSYYANVYRILIASPGDVLNERAIIKEVIHEWNVINSAERGIVLLPIMWETHAAPESGTKAQIVINRDLVESCDLAIGAFWTRIGTPTDDFESGTAEEIEKMCSNGKLVMVYFSKRNLPYDHDAEQFQRLKSFRAKSFTNSLVAEFSSLEDFKSQLSRDLAIRTKDLLNVVQSVTKHKMVQSSKVINGVEHSIVRFLNDDNQDRAEDKVWMLTILELLLDCSSYEGYSWTELASRVKISGGEFKIYMDMLSERDYIERDKMMCAITIKGRNYIISNSQSK